MSDNVSLSTQNHDPNVELKLSANPSLYLLLGKQGSGKTHLLKDLFYSFLKNDFYEFGYAYSASSHYAEEKDALSFLEPKHVYRGYSEKHLQGYIEGLIQYKEKLKKDGKPMPRNFLIFDDVLKLVNFNSDWFANWLARFRHTNTDVYFTAQYLKGGLGTTFREYCNASFMFAQDSARSLKGVYEEFGCTAYEKLDDFIQMFTRETKPDHQCVVYVRKLGDLKTSWFTHKAGVPPRYLFKYNIP
jgi:hypothetical protein